MFRWLLTLPLVALVLATPALSRDTKDEKEKKTGLVKGQDLPGTFQPFNINGPRANRYHCLVTQTSLDPVVMLFVRDLDYSSDALKALEEALDNRIEKNPNVRLSSFTVFVSDELPKVVEEDDKREKIAEDLRTKAKDLKHVVFCLDSKPDLEDYKLDDNAWATIVLVKRYKALSIHTLAKDKLDKAKVDEIMAEVSDLLGATRK